jgi:uncharacterized damage-inducible protein DinB
VFDFQKNLILSLKKLDEAQLDDDLGGSFLTIRATIYHIWMAESIWLQRLLMKEQIVLPHENFTGTFDEACDAWQLVSKQLVDYVLLQRDEKMFSHEVRYYNLKKEPFKNEVWEMIHHCMNHSTFHRGQIIHLIRKISIMKITSTDFITFQREVK